MTGPSQPEPDVAETGAGVTAELARQASALRFADLPADVVTLAQQCVLDTLGVAVAGLSEPVTAVVRKELAAPGEVPLWGGGRADPHTAALINGVAAHALDFDDYAPASGLHPSAPVLPAVSAAAFLARRRGRAVDGRDLLTAFVAGYEVQERIGAALWPSHYGRGFHTTGTVGTLGAATAAAHVLGLDPPTTATALSLAATDAAGVKAVFGSMGKPWQAGRAAAAGLRAARLAAAGLTLGPDAVFGGQGLVAATSDDADLHLARTDFGRPWHLRDVLPKLYPSCFGTHAAIECALRLRTQAGGADVRDVELTIPPVLLQVCAVPRPATGLEGKFSLAFTTALAWQEGAVTVGRLSDAAVGEPVLRALAGRVRLRCDESLPKTATRMRVRLEDGREVRTEADSTSRRWVRDPVEVWPGLTRKFVSLAEPVLGAAGAERTVSAVAHLDREGAASAVELFAAVGAAEAATSVSTSGRSC